MTLIDFVFPKLRTLKTWLDKCLKSPVSEDPSTSNMVNVRKHYWNLHHSTFIIFLRHWPGNFVRKTLSYYWSLATKLCSKKSLLLTCQILGLLVNTLAADEKYPVLNRDNLAIPIQMQLSQKQKTFSRFFAAFLKFRLIFKYFEQKHHPHRFCNVKITDSKKLVR